MKKKILLIGLGLLCLVVVSCRNGCSKKPAKVDSINVIDSVAVQPKSEIAQTINVYIENSGSMDGYVNGNTEFKGAIRDLLVMLKYHYGEKNTRVFFINSDVHSTATSADLATFAQNINTLWYVGDRSHSKLNNIFKKVLEKTNNNSISILFSDYIYSIAGKNTNGLLNDEKSLTKDAFLSKWKNDKVQLATTIVKMKSKFKGRYFPYTGDQYCFEINMERPYYICIIGNQEFLNDFNKKIELKEGKIEGFENKYVLSSEDPKNIYYSILNFSFNKGRFKIDRDNSCKDYTHGIKDAEPLHGSDSLTIALAVDFSNVQAENDYICNLENYEVPTGNFEVAKVFPLVAKEIHKSDWNTIKDYHPTHVIVMRSTTRKLHDSDVNLVLKKQMPQWIYSSSAEDDTTPTSLKDKTFGLKYWVEGIAEAYETIYPNNTNYFECSFSIK